MFYNLDNFLFEKVQQKFEKSGKISAFDFHCILIWKANRAKNKHRKRLCRNGRSYKSAVSHLILGLVNRKSPEEKLEWMMSGAGFRLPTASAILTVLYPLQFTVYDVRVCDQLGKFHELKDYKFTGKLWEKYVEFKRCVEKKVPGNYSLRDKDKFLWGKSFFKQVKKEIL